MSSLVDVRPSSSPIVPGPPGAVVGACPKEMGRVSIGAVPASAEKSMLRPSKPPDDPFPASAGGVFFVLLTHSSYHAEHTPQGYRPRDGSIGKVHTAVHSGFSCGITS